MRPASGAGAGSTSTRAGGWGRRRASEAGEAGPFGGEHGTTTNVGDPEEGGLSESRRPPRRRLLPPTSSDARPPGGGDGILRRGALHGDGFFRRSRPMRSRPEARTPSCAAAPSTATASPADLVRCKAARRLRHPAPGRRLLLAQRPYAAHGQRAHPHHLLLPLERRQLKIVFLNRFSFMSLA